MAKFLKTCLIIGAICIAVGFAASAAGIQAGGWKELKEQIKNGEWSIDPEDINLGIDPFYELEDQNYYNKNEKIYTNEELVEEAFVAADFQKIHVKGAGIAIKFLSHDGSDVIVRATKSGKYQGYIKENVLYITASGKSEKDFGDGLIQIQVPQSLYDAALLEIIVEASAGTVDFGEIQAAKVELEVSAGTINWAGLRAKELEINMAAGTVKGENTIISNSTDIDMKAGAVTLEGVLGAEVDMEVAAGKITLQLPHVMEDYNYDLSCAGGSIKLGKESLEGIAKERKIDNHAAYNMGIECSVGSVEISFVTP